MCISFQQNAIHTYFWSLILVNGKKRHVCIGAHCSFRIPTYLTILIYINLNLKRLYPRWFLTSFLNLWLQNKLYNTDRWRNLSWDPYRMIHRISSWPFICNIYIEKCLAPQIITYLQNYHEWFSLDFSQNHGHPISSQELAVSTLWHFLQTDCKIPPWKSYIKLHHFLKPKKGWDICWPLQPHQSEHNSFTLIIPNGLSIKQSFLLRYRYALH